MYAVVYLKPKQLIIKDCARRFVEAIQARSIARPLSDSRASCYMYNRVSKKLLVTINTLRRVLLLPQNALHASSCAAVSGSGPRLLGRIGSGVQTSANFQKQISRRVLSYDSKKRVYNPRGFIWGNLTSYQARYMMAILSVCLYVTLTKEIVDKLTRRPHRDKFGLFYTECHLTSERCGMWVR